MLDSIIQQRANGNPTLILTTTAKLVLKGVNPARFNASSPDEPQIVAKLRSIAAEMGVRV